MTEVAVADIAERVEYGVTASAESAPVGPRMLRITDIQDGAVDWNSVPWCPADTKGVGDRKLAPGDIVFARTGATTGKSFLIRDCPDDSVFASYLIRLRLAEGVDPSYVGHFFQTSSYWRQITQVSEGVAQPGVNATKLKNLRLPLPPIEEQRRIAAVLDTADALRAKRRQALAKLDTLTQAIFIDMFGTPQTNLHGFEEAVLGDLVEVKGGKRLPKGSDYSSVQTKYPYIRVTDFKKGSIDTSHLLFLTPAVQETISRYVVSAGDVIISIAGSIGQIASVPESLDGANLTENAAKLVRRNSGILTTEYLASFLRSGFAQKQISAKTGQVTIGKLALFRIASLRVLLPPIELQRRYERRLVEVSRLMPRLVLGQKNLDDLFDSLQQRAFRGDL